MNNLKHKLHEIIFEADTRVGKRFDIALILLIVLSVIIVIIESDPDVPSGVRIYLEATEWLVTILFSIEYLLRIWVVNKPRNYIFSFFGIIDLLAILPTYLGLFIGGAPMLMVVRSLRLIRIFRVLKLTRYIKEASVLGSALVSSRNKIGVFLFVVVILVVILGTVMYLIETPVNTGFNNISHSIYWAIVTLTTVGYGDIAPITFLGKFVAGFIMIIGYAIIAVPTGIVTSELVKDRKASTNTQVCASCMADDHEDDAKFCKHCGTKL